MKLTELPEEELRAISMKKKKNGCSTAEALRAQSILYHRANPWIGCGRRCHLDMDGRSYKGDGNEGC